MIECSPSVITKRPYRCGSGFSLVELAVVLALVGLLMSGLMYTLQAQSLQRSRDETTRRLEEAKALLVAFAMVNGRLPCPAVAGSNGNEAPAGGGTCTSNFGGFLPATAIGFQPVDAQGFAYDSWGNRIRYAVANNVFSQAGASPVCRPGGAAPTLPHFTHKANLKANGIDCAPNDLVICSVAPAGPNCGAGNAVTNQRVAAAVVYSIGKNGPLATTDVDELENTDGDAVFVDKPLGAMYDDMVLWIPVGALYGRMVAAGSLP
jgi:prepilin-type N-terminal cleavage/methylation domain-containing protein